jgi:Iap family predicted aminopeptidase
MVDGALGYHAPMRHPLLLLVAALPSAGSASEGPVARITGAALTRGGAMAFVERLADGIGGRVTGSPQSRAASELLLATLQEAGLEDVRVEEYALESRWERGTASARVVRPVDRPVLAGSFGWSPGTAGSIEAPLVDLGAVTDPGGQVPAERVRGAAVLADFSVVEGHRPFVIRARLARQLAHAGAAALLVPSDKPGRMLDIGCFGNYPRAALPMLSVGLEDGLFLRRLLARGPVTLALDVRNSLDAAAYRERNVVADLRGRERPEEMVLLGAHLDSWETAQGANDNAAGVAVLVEAARVLRSLGLRPRRTIRFAFFTGEEQALLGSRAYVEAHQAELDLLRAVLVVDHGAGARQVPRGVHVNGRTDLQAAAARLLAPLQPLGAGGVSPAASFDTDHGFFLAAGVPALTLWVDEGEYEVHHHAITDSRDKVDPHVLALQTAVVAAVAFSLAEAEEPLGPRLSQDQAAALLRRAGLESSHRLLAGVD